MIANISFEMDTDGMLTVDDAINGRRSYSIANGNLPIIVDQYKFLATIAKKKVTQHLLDDLSVYGHILTAKDPEAMATAYFQKKEEMGGISIGGAVNILKRDVANALGWRVEYRKENDLV